MVFDDADVDRAVRDALEGGYYNKGEACTAASRVIIQKGLADTFVNQLAKGVKALKVGAGNDPATHVGPAVSKEQQSKVLKYIEVGKREGARVVAEGRLPSDPALAGGFFVPPTLLADVRPDARAAQEDLWGTACSLAYTRATSTVRCVFRVELTSASSSSTTISEASSVCHSAAPRTVATAANTRSRHSRTSGTRS
jgi:acyl-CoA reductase-like NAD-dependent aldehyde dehydrogenase